MNELVSVIVPIYNIEDYLPRCLLCIEKQTYRNLDIILVDDGSTDSSGKICDEYAKRDTRARVIHKQNGGLWTARNTGQDAALGNYLWFPDGDDYFHYDIINQMLLAINKDGNEYDVALVGVSITNSFDGDVVSKLDDSKYRELTQEELITNLFSLHFFDGFMWNKLYRRNLIQNLRTNDYQRSQDWDFSFRVYLRTHKAIAMKNELYFWFQRSESALHSPEFHNLFMDCKIRMLYRNIIELNPEHKLFQKHLLHTLYKMIVTYEEELFGTNKQREIIQQYRPIVRGTWLSYIKCGEIPFTERVVRLVMVSFPRTAHYLLNIRGWLPWKRIWTKSLV